MVIPLEECIHTFQFTFILNEICFFVFRMPVENDEDGYSVDKLNTSTKLSTSSTITPAKPPRDHGPISTPVLESTTNSNIVLQDLPSIQDSQLDNPTYFSNGLEPDCGNRSSPTLLRVVDLCQGSNNSSLKRSNGSIDSVGLVNATSANADKRGSDSSCAYEEPGDVLTNASKVSADAEDGNVYSDVEDDEGCSAETALIRDRGSSPENAYEVPDVAKK